MARVGEGDTNFRILRGILRTKPVREKILRGGLAQRLGYPSSPRMAALFLCMIWRPR